MPAGWTSKHLDRMNLQFFLQNHFSQSLPNPCSSCFSCSVCAWFWICRNNRESFHIIFFLNSWISSWTRIQGDCVGVCFSFLKSIWSKHKKPSFLMQTTSSEIGIKFRSSPFWSWKNILCANSLPARMNQHFLLKIIPVLCSVYSANSFFHTLLQKMKFPPFFRSHKIKKIA